ncbi:uncharacterized protein LOC110831030 isoform X3 [Zootermopsis nevadensis]|uniref:uncharacterized protein LOC110831030 isoform X3 n=1 Tax=Zootermopsis nevadensis TaxID=136037 RepID=UPI000B8E78F4|nr:uncharacterized protein LOC110831030 isoform X3 [Zootermopsis nevadensis]
MANAYMVSIFIFILVGHLVSAGFYADDNMCSDENATCTSEFSYTTTYFNCTVVPVSQSECANWTFNDDSYIHLGSAKLEAYPYITSGRVQTNIKLTLSDIKLTSLRFRFQQHGKKENSFCREFRLSSNYSISELIYNCGWLHKEYEGTVFGLEYEAYERTFREVRKYVFQIPLLEHIGRFTRIQDWIPFLYVDVSELPLMTAKWQHAPPWIDALKYNVAVYSNNELRENETYEGPFPMASELHYLFYPNSVPGTYHFELAIISNSCDSNICHISRSPDIVVGVHNTEKKTLVVGIVGCVILIPLLLLISHMWRRQCRSPNGSIKLPAVLIVYTPSRASHVEAMVALAEYLRNYCAVEALLDQLDVPETETKDPFAWCNGAFTRADFVMVVSSPPKCCNQEGAFGNVNVDVLQILKERFSSCSSRPCFFNILLPYCTIQDIPDEAKNFKMFKLFKDLDKMLWHIHNGACSAWTFSTTLATHPALVKLLAVPQCEESRGFAIVKILLTDVKWTNLTNTNNLSQWSPFLYVDVSDLPSLTVRWLQAPKSFGVQKYELKVHDNDELKETKVFIGTEQEEMSYTYSEYILASGKYKFEVRILNDYCENGACPVSESPVIIVNVSTKKVLAVGIIGSLGLICMLTVILYSWKKFKLPKNIKPPKLLVIYTQSNASHIKVVEELAKYLRKYCFVDALLDQLDIPKTQSKDPYEWYNDAFVHLDFVMVVSSPPKCCNQGLYRDVDIIAFNFLKAKFSDRCQFFSVLLPYCTELDIPNEAKHFQKFKLTKDLDKMLWFIRNGGKFPTFMESACALLGPKVRGGESDLELSGINLLKAMKLAGDDLLKVCCHKNLKNEGNSTSEKTRLQMLIHPAQDVTNSSPKLVQQSRDVSKMNPHAEMNYEDSMEISLDYLDLSGPDTLYPESLSKRRDADQAVCDLDTLAL